MTVSIDRPDDQALMTVLDRALASTGRMWQVRSIGRQENVYESTNRTEVIVCTLESAQQVRLLCKYGPASNRSVSGLSQGLAYEATIYREILEPLDGPAPRFYGAYDEPDTGVSWLFVEYLGEGWQLDLGPETAIVDAARIIGDFHRGAAATHHLPWSPGVNLYGRRYFRSCLMQALSLAGLWRAQGPAFDQLVDRFESEMERLLDAPQTVIHGQYTPHNVVWADERPHPVDWEEAAISAGEIDLACLTDEWPTQLVDMAQAAYKQARWPEGPPHDFPSALGAARLYWLFRWLGDPDQVGTEDERRWVVGRMEEVAQLHLP
jgi:hypothetical protein